MAPTPEKAACRCSNGFTLVELLVIIAILAITSAIAAPNLLVWRENTQLSAAARDLFGHLQSARLTAIQRNTYCSISFNITVDSKNYDYAVYTDPGEDISYTAGTDTVIHRVSWSSDYGSTVLNTGQGGGDGLSLSNPNDGLAFGPDGLPKKNGGALGGGTIYLKNDHNRNVNVVIATTGSIRIE